MRCVVTAGPTYEPLDQVRRLTNFSTGRLGSGLANFLSQHGHEVTLLFGQQATWAGEQRARAVQHFTTTTDLRERLQALSSQRWDAVFHAAAVSDFSFGKVWERTDHDQLTEVKSGKLSSRQGTLLAELVPTQKLIRELRGWFGSARLVGWKYEVDGQREEALAAARAQISESRTDACVANGPSYGEGFGLIAADGQLNHCGSREQLFAALEQLVSGRPRPN